MIDVSPVRNDSKRTVVNVKTQRISNGVSRFEIIAYQNASRAVENYKGNVLALYNKEGQNGLQKIEGIGETISENIAEFIDTGKSSKKEKLIKKIPKIKIEINNIPGVGPVTTNKIYQALKPKNISDLAIKITSSAYQNKLSAVSIKEKTIQNILANLNLTDKEKIKISFSKANAVAVKFINYIKKIPGVEKSDIVGSLRRKQKFVHDIDLVASCNSNQIKVLEEFIKYARVKSAIAKGTTKASVYSKEGYRIDLGILPTQNYGNLLQHFTGSKEHNIKLRTYARKNGFSVSEHGIKILKNGIVIKIIKCKDEECVYQTLGLQYIPPELRTGENEIKLALKNR